MEEQEFLRMAKQMKVENTLYTHACVARDGVLKDAYAFGDIDWRATSLNLASALDDWRATSLDLASALDKSRDSIELIEATDQRNLQNLEDKQAELSELQGRLEGRDELVATLEERNTRLQDGKFDLYVIIERLAAVALLEER
jgi:GAF domain-containing protein